MNLDLLIGLVGGILLWLVAPWLLYEFAGMAGLGVFSALLVGGFLWARRSDPDGPGGSRHSGGG